MSIRNLHLSFAACCTFVLLLGGLLSGAEPPNFVIINIDDLGYALFK